MSYFKDAYVHERAKNQLEGSNGNYNNQKDEENMNGLKSIIDIDSVENAPAGTGRTSLPSGDPISSEEHKQLSDQINDLKKIKLKTKKKRFRRTDKTKARGVFGRPRGTR